MTKPVAAPSKWYSIRARSAAAVAAAALAAGGSPVAEAEIYIYGDIGESWYEETVTAAQFVRDLNALNVNALTVRINSIGGSAMDGIAIYNALKRHPATVHVAIDSFAASIAALIAMAGDTVEMADNALLMIHGGSTGVYGNATEMRDAADMLDQWNAAMATSFAAKTGRPEAEMLTLLTDGKDHYYTAAEALAGKFIDSTTTALPIAAALRDSIDLSRYGKTLPAALARVQPTPAAAGTTLEISKMTTPNPAATDEQAAIVAKATAAGVTAEAQRRTEIRAAFEPFAAREGVTTLLTKLEADPAVTAAAAKQELLMVLAKNTTAAAGNYVVTLTDERDKIHAGIVEALMARASVAGKDGPIRVTAGNPFRGMKLFDIARASLERGGVKTEGMDPMKLVAAAFTQSTSDFPILLENTMHKTLQIAYAVAPDTWSRWCKTGSVTDFRAHPRYRVGSLASLDSLTELGEFKNKTIPDGEKASITAGTKGNLINISRQVVINDDLDAFIGLSSMLGRAAKRTIERDVYALLATNPVLTDGVALFHATHGNLAAVAAAPAVTVIDLGRVAMASQLDVGGNDYLDIRPSVWLGPLSLGGTTRVINRSEYDPDTPNKLQRPNQVANLFKDIIDTPRLAGTAWYMFADKEEAPVFEVAFLNGNQEPFLDMEMGFGVDGTSWKVRIDFGVAAIDYRGGFKNAGA